jgi:uncharacterized protein with GYD domain
MNTYFMFGKYSAEAIKGVSAERTKKANDIILKLGGKILAQYALLGDKDLIFIVNLPGVEEVIKASASLHKLTGISFSSVPAISIEKFDQIMS